MGSNSNRTLNKEEKMVNYAKEIIHHSNNPMGKSAWDFETSIGARIRGEMGIEKGNKFIESIKQASR